MRGGAVLGKELSAEIATRLMWSEGILGFVCFLPFFFFAQCSWWGSWGGTRGAQSLGVSL